MRIFPFKSLGGVDIATATIVASGALGGDREFGFFDERGLFINAKREPRVHALRVDYDPVLTVATFRSSFLNTMFIFGFDEHRDALEAWLGRHFEQPVFVRRSGDGGFPDDTKAPGPTVISTATLHEVAAWFPALDVVSIRERLRTNLEISGLAPFGEDALYAGAGEPVQFRIGDVTFEGSNPCQRCVVPTHDPETGEAFPAFAKTVSTRRERALPPFAERSRFDHFYRLAVNTCTPATEVGKRVAVGDPVEMLTYARVQIVLGNL